MAVIKSGDSPILLTVDPGTNAARVSIYPKKSTNTYVVRATTGVLAAALAVDAPIFAMRHSTTPTRDVYINFIQASFSWVAAATAAQQFGFYIERFSAAPLGGGAVYTPFRLDTGYPASQVADIRASTTAALTTTGVVFEGIKVPIMGWTNQAVGAGVLDMPVVWNSLINGQIRLRAGEGLCIRNLIVWPAAGTGVFTCIIGWSEE